MNFSKNEAIAHIVFDNDGTMVNSEGNFFEVLAQVLPKHLGREITHAEILKNNIPDWYQLLKNYGVENPTTEFVKAIIEDVNEYNKDYLPKLYQGTKELLASLHELKIATYVWTGRDKVSGMKIFDGLDLTPLFFDMQFVDTCTPKPHPDGLSRMLPGIEKKNIALIGDSVVDLAGAKSFGIPCLIVDWHKSIDQSFFNEQGAELIVQTHQEILDWAKQKFVSA
jgi:phosphoglycolate phosphatase-like HAD superfamily hydrolase